MRCVKWTGICKAGHFWVVDADLQHYFDTIPHAPLLAKVGRRIADGRVLVLVQRFLSKTSWKT